MSPNNGAVRPAPTPLDQQARQTAEETASQIDEMAVDLRVREIRARREAERIVRAEDRGTTTTGGWRRVDLADVLTGARVMPSPGLLHREDGVGLFYPGLTHQIIGPPESGKSWMALLAVAAVLERGGRVAYIDHESTDMEIVSRLRALGVADQAIADGLHYLHPEIGVADDPEGFEHLTQQQFEMVVIDGWTDALGVHGIDVIDNSGIAGWFRAVADRLAATGAAVIMIDHVTKTAAAGGAARYGIGGQIKLGRIRGVSYSIEPVVQPAPGSVGDLIVKLTKDSPGAVRRHCLDVDGDIRIKNAARITLDATRDGVVTARIMPPLAGAAPPPGATHVLHGGRAYDRDTAMMERVSRVLEAGPDGMYAGQIRRSTTGKNDKIDLAVAALLREGWISQEDRANGGKWHRLLRTFRRAVDPGPPEAPNVPAVLLDRAAVEAALDVESTGGVDLQ